MRTERDDVTTGEPDCCSYCRRMGELRGLAKSAPMAVPIPSEIDPDFGVADWPAYHPRWQAIAEPTRVHAERSGPAFAVVDTPPFVVELARSLQVQAVEAAGDVLMAIERAVLCDVFPAWTRLIRALDVSVTAPTLRLGTLRHGTRTLWDTLRRCVVSALANAQALDARRHWLHADAVMHAAARERCELIDAQFARAAELTDYDMIEDGPGLTAGEASALRAELGACRAFTARVTR